MRKTQSSNSGFTLIELSIVLIVIGLIAGGVMAGQSMVKAAELRNITAAMEKTQVVLYTFRGKYSSFPGDMPNATTFWGAQNSDPVACATALSTTALTCNGDGDGKIEAGGSGTSNRYEPYRLWQHLSNAGLVEGNYSGVAVGGTSTIPGTNVLSLKRNNVGINVSYFVTGGSIFQYAFPAGHYINVGSGTTGAWLTGAAVTAAEAYKIDLKIDDGTPNKGRMMTRGNYSWNPDCVVSTNDAYNMASNLINVEVVNTNARSPGCQFAFRFGN